MQSRQKGLSQEIAAAKSGISIRSGRRVIPPLLTEVKVVVSPRWPFYVLALQPIFYAGLGL